MHAENRKAPRIIRLKRETVRVLDAEDLTRVGGGTVASYAEIGPSAACFIMKDTIIVPTSHR